VSDLVRIGYHASHEQFSPSELLRFVQMAEQVGFHEAKSSDHFHPWSERQGQSGHAWSWLGAALQATRFPIGVISAPGYRYHPAVLAQAAATLGEMYPGRFWLALGSGEAINEAITGAYWPEKAERNEKLRECVEVTRRLFAGELVTHRGRVTVVEAKLYSRPARPVPLFGAAITEQTAAFAATWADGLLLAGHQPKTVAQLVKSFRDAGGKGKPVHLQMAVSLSETVAEAKEQALDQWSAAAIGGGVNLDLRRPKDFDLASRMVSAEDIINAVLVTSSASQIGDAIGAAAELSIDVVHLHQVGRDQEDFIERVGAHVLPAFE
jgi:coenzyme F420-dependent glucose-6-phosphate dehydrogenase